jgi:hypothetical protein
MTDEEVVGLVTEALSTLCLRAGPDATAVTVCEVLQRDRVGGTPSDPIDCALAVWLREATGLPKVFVAGDRVLIRNGGRGHRMLVVLLPDVVASAVTLLDKSRFIITNGRKS